MLSAAVKISTLRVKNSMPDDRQYFAKLDVTNRKSLLPNWLSLTLTFFSSSHVSEKYKHTTEPHIQIAKGQISLYICAVWQDFQYLLTELLGTVVYKYIRHWSDYIDLLDQDFQ